MTAKPPPGPGTPLIEYPWVVIRFRCHYCERGGDSRTVACAIDFGSHATLNELLHVFMRACPWNPHSKHRKPQKYGMMRRLSARHRPNFAARSAALYDRADID